MFIPTSSALNCRGDEDGIDNDGDGLTDEENEEIRYDLFADGTDNDGDGQVDEPGEDAGYDLMCQHVNDLNNRFDFVASNNGDGPCSAEDGCLKQEPYNGLHESLTTPLVTKAMAFLWDALEEDADFYCSDNNDYFVASAFSSISAAYQMGPIEPDV